MAEYLPSQGAWKPRPPEASSGSPWLACVLTVATLWMARSGIHSMPRYASPIPWKESSSGDLPHDTARWHSSRKVSSVGCRGGEVLPAPSLSHQVQSRPPELQQQSLLSVFLLPSRMGQSVPYTAPNESQKHMSDLMNHFEIVSLHSLSHQLHLPSSSPQKAPL